VDGTLIEAWASQKSFQKKDGGDGDPGQFRGERRSNQTHESKTDPEARLYRKGHGQEAKLGYLGHVLMENRGCQGVEPFFPLPQPTLSILSIPDFKVYTVSVQ
jgi:hypothetical protein